MPDDDDAPLHLAIVPYQPLVINPDSFHLGILKVFYGPVQPPAMVWERSFRNLIPAFSVRSVPACLDLTSLPLGFAPKGDWINMCNTSLQPQDSRVSEVALLLLNCSEEIDCTQYGANLT